MNTKENHLQILLIGRNALITAIMALEDDYNIQDLEDLRDEVNRRIKDLEAEE